MSKELWIEAHDRLIAEYMDRHMRADWRRAYEATANKVDQQVADDLAARIDAERDRRKYE